MRDDDALAIHIHSVAAERVGDVLVGQAVETVAPDALVRELPRQGHQHREPR